MADLDFSHNVSEIPAGQALPQPYHKSVGVEVTPFPDMQSAITNYADATNWMSSVGSAVASRASNAIAERLGSELGKNPQGDLGVPLTDFDEKMQKSYESQAHATLGLQANKLITDANLETAKADKMSPELIAQTQKQVSVGLQNIFKNAPASIQGNLAYQYGNLQISQYADLTERMYREQKQDRKNQASAASQQYAENAYTFGLKGNDKAALAVLDSTKKLGESQVGVRDITPEDAKSRYDTARKSYLSGKMIHDYNNSSNKEAYLKSIADKKPHYLSDTDYMSVTNSLMEYVNHQNSLRSQDQSLSIAKFKTSIAMNPLSPDMTQQLQELKSNVSPEAYEQAQLHYINAVKTFTNEQGEANNALSSWNDPSSFARLTEKGINKAFDMQTARYVEQRQQEGEPISIDEAEVQVAASAGGKVPVFEKSLENKLLRGSPADILSASNQMEMLSHMKEGRVYDGISQKAKTIATLFQQQRGSMPDEDLARQITDNLSNVDEKMQKTLDNSWNLILSSKGASGLGANKSLGNFALEQVSLGGNIKLNKDTLGGSYFNTIYGNDIYNQLNSNFIATRGDFQAAKKMTQDYVDQHYSETHVNGMKQISDSSIEKYLGYNGNDITPYVQQDMLNQLSVHFSEAKKSNPHDYWETLPLKNGVAEAVRTVNGKQYRYPINLLGRAGNQWDVIAQTPYGLRNLFLIAPQVGVSSYQPNKDAIIKSYKARTINHSYIGRT